MESLEQEWQWALVEEIKALRESLEWAVDRIVVAVSKTAVG